MSNKLTRSGLAFGTAVAFVLASLVATVPANAAVPSVTLNPALGSTYESINQSGIAIATSLDSGVGAEDTEGLKWRITSANSNYTTDEILDLITDGDLNVSIVGGEDEFQFDYNGSSYIRDVVEDEDSWSIDKEVDLQGSAVVVKAWDNSEDAPYYAYYEDTTYLQMYTVDGVDLDDIKLSVRGWADEDGDNEISAGEARSSAVSVTLYDVRTISATTTIEEAEVTSPASPLVAKTVLNKPNINTWFVSKLYSLNGSVAGAHYANNSYALEDAWNLSGFNVAPIGWNEDYDEENSEDDNIWNFPLYSESTEDVFLDDTSVNYSTRAWFTNDASEDDAADFVNWLGARSSTTSVVAGTNANVVDIYGFVTDGDNLVDNEDGTLDVRDGTKSGVVSAQITDSEDVDMTASNVRVRATFSYTSLEEDGELTVTGATGAAAPGEDLVAFARTDAKGQVSFTFNNSNADAEDNDQMVVSFEVLKSNAVWESAPTMTFNWEVAELDSFTVSDDALSGSSISLTYEAVDQFGKGVSAVGTDEDDVLQVTLTGLEDDDFTLDKTALVPTTKPLSNGVATFTFSNYAAVDSFVGVVGILHTAGDDFDDFDNLGIDAFYEITYVYKNDATSMVDSVENEYSTVVTYANFYNGNASEDEDLNENIEDYGVWNVDFNDEDEWTWIEGSVLTANDNGAAFQAVTVSGTGLYFQWDREDYVFATGSITIETDADGQFGFYVYSHKHNTAGQSITITSGGKSFTTKLKTFMNPEIDFDERWNGSAWVDAAKVTTNWVKLTGNNKDGVSAPSRNANYIVTATAKDVWGNALVGAEVRVDTENISGSLFNANYNDVESGGMDGTADANADGKIRFSAKANIADYANRNEGFELYVWLHEYDYDAGTGNEDFDFFTDVEGFGGVFESTGVFGPQAHAFAGAKKGVVRVHAFNAKGKTVSVFVGGKLVKTATSDKARFLTKVKGVKAGDKRVTVKVGAKRMLSTFVSVK